METAVQSATSVAQVLAEATATLQAAGVESARLNAELLLAAVCAVDRRALYLRAREPLSSVWRDRFAASLVRRMAREPLQYIVGCQEFWSLDFVVTPDVLIPRPETELLVETALRISLGSQETVDKQPPPSIRREENAATRGERTRSLQENSGNPFTPSRPLLFRGRIEGLPRTQSTGSEPIENNGVQGQRLTICDVGTGSGCIAVALAHELPDAEIWALDMSSPALAVAQANAARHAVAERIRFVQSDLLDAVSDQCFDVIVSNPPYVSTAELQEAQPELRYEPRGALDGGNGGLDVIRRLVAMAAERLVEGGWLIMEIGADHGGAVCALTSAAKFDDIAVRNDYAGLPRVLVARR